MDAVQSDGVDGTGTRSGEGDRSRWKEAWMDARLALPRYPLPRIPRTTDPRTSVSRWSRPP